MYQDREYVQAKIVARHHHIPKNKCRNAVPPMSICEPNIVRWIHWARSRGRLPTSHFARQCVQDCRFLLDMNLFDDHPEPALLYLLGFSSLCKNTCLPARPRLPALALTALARNKKSSHARSPNRHLICKDMRRLPRRGMPNFDPASCLSLAIGDG